MTWDEIKDPSPDFVERVLDIVRGIPAGRVTTYGDIAAAPALEGHPDLTGAVPALGARLVGQVMARFGEDVPWWRVIRSSGEPPKFHEARAWTYYMEEGTPLSGSQESYRIDLKRARHRPGSDADAVGQIALDL